MDSPDALFIEICEDGTFKFYVWQDVLGKGLESGIWHRKADTIFFEPVKRFGAPETKIYSENSNLPLAKLTFYAVHADGDTLSLGLLDSLLVNKKMYPIDSNGTVYLDSTPLNPIEVKPWSSGMLDLTDSVFHLNQNKNEFEIYISRGYWQPFSYDMATGKMLLRGRKLLYIDSLGQLDKKFILKKHKNGCGHIKDSD